MATSDTTLTAALANVLASVTAEIPLLNAARTQDYLGVFNEYAASIAAGRPNASAPPQPPNAYVVGYITDPTNPTAQWAYPAVGTVPVCPMPALPGVVVHQDGTAYIGIAIVGAPGWFSMDTGDTTPNGTVVPGTSRDGVTGLFKCVRSVVGGWYLKVG